MGITDVFGAPTDQMNIAYEGMVAEGQSVRDVASRVVQVPYEIGFGMACGAGSSDGSCALGAANFVGISVADKSQTYGGFKADEMIGLIRKGTIWVLAATEVKTGDPVTFKVGKGVIGAGLDGKIPNAKFETTGKYGTLVKVYLG